MPLTEFQKEIFRLLRSNRSPDSFVVGATVLNAAESSPRFSRDIDLSHDVADSVSSSALADQAALRAAGFRCEFTLQQPTFQRASVSRGESRVLLEWVYDSAFRFFPVEEDPELGYRLHFLDAATNKILALAGRSEPRDFVDAIQLHQNHLSLGALAWAAAGKDEGLNPLLILDLANRFAHYRQQEIDALDLVQPLRLTDLKAIFRDAIEQAEGLVRALPADEVGCLYLNDQGVAVEPDPCSGGFANLKRHYGSVGGAWPRLGR